LNKRESFKSLGADYFLCWSFQREKRNSSELDKGIGKRIIKKHLSEILQFFFEKASMKKKQNCLRIFLEGSCLWNSERKNRKLEDLL